MITLRSIRRLINRLRGVPLVLACLLASACTGQVAGEPAADPCDAARAECFAACPVNAGPGATAADSCMASCNAEHGLCVSPPPAALTCARIDSEPHACASSGCWATYQCNRDPSAEMGVTCSAAGAGVFACKW